MDRYLAAAKAICDNYDLHGYRESDFDPVQDIAETIAEQLADVTRERDEAKTCLEKFMGLIETDGKYGLLCDGTYPYATVTGAMQAAHDMNCEQLGRHQLNESSHLQRAIKAEEERNHWRGLYNSECAGTFSDKQRIAHLETTVRNYQSAANKIAVELNEVASDRHALREQLATVQRVLVESLNLTEVGNEFAPPCVDVDNAMSLSAAAEVAIDTLKLSAEKHKLDAEEANKALATVQAEAAAMRANVHEVVKEFRKLEAMEGNEPIRCSRIHFGNWADQLLKPTSGRELLDELADLRKRLASISEMHHDLDRENARLERKAHNAKLAYVENLRGKIDPAWFGEQSSVWQYRGHAHGAVWRTCDGKMIEYGKNRLGWDRSTAYRDWEECCADMRTYPCDENGKRLSDGGAK